MSDLRDAADIKAAILRGLPLLADPGRTADRIIRKLDAAGFEVARRPTETPMHHHCLRCGGVDSCADGCVSL